MVLARLIHLKNTNSFWSCWGNESDYVWMLDLKTNDGRCSRPQWSQHGVYGGDAGLGSRGRIYRLCPNGPLLQVSGGTQKPLPLPQVSRVFSLCRSSWWSQKKRKKRNRKKQTASVVSWRSLFSFDALVNITAIETKKKDLIFKKRIWILFKLLYIQTRNPFARLANSHPSLFHLIFL